MLFHSFVIFKYMITEDIKHISYNYLKQELKVVYSNGNEKYFPMTEEEYK